MSYLSLLVRCLSLDLSASACVSVFDPIFFCFESMLGVSRDRYDCVSSCTGALCSVWACDCVRVHVEKTSAYVPPSKPKHASGTNRSTRCTCKAILNVRRTYNSHCAFSSLTVAIFGVSFASECWGHIGLDLATCS